MTQEMQYRVASRKVSKQARSIVLLAENAKYISRRTNA